MAYPLPYVAILDIGHGNSNILRDGDDTFIIDCGAQSAGLMDFLKKEGIKEVRKIYISHADQDHIGGLVGILASNEFVIHEVVVNSDSTKGNLWDDLVYQLDELRAARKLSFSVGISRTDKRDSCGNIEIEIAGPTPYLAAKGVGSKDKSNRTINSNSISASFIIHWNDQPIAFLAGDVDQIGLDDLIREKAVLTAQLLVFPHHGGKSGQANPVPFTQLLCDQISPQTVLFSIGRERFENPRPEIVDAVRKRIKDVRITCTQMSRHCEKLIKFKVNDHLVDVYSRGRDDHFCCTGTFILRLDKKVEHLPSVGKHLDFVKQAASTPMCI